MKRKILIIESDRLVLCAMVRIARDAGHKVMGIFLGERPPTDDSLIATSDPEQAIVSALAFKPDIALIEHDFGLGAHVAGSYLVKRLGLPRRILIGTSVVNEQLYCERKLSGKVMLGVVESAKSPFLSLLSA